MSYQQANTVVAGNGQWDPEDPKYKCCCNRSNVMRGALIVGILEASAFAVLILNCIIRLKKVGSDIYGAHFAVSLICAILFGIVIALLFYGLKKEKSKFLLPHLAFQILAVTVLFILSLVTIILLAMGSVGPLAAFLGTDPVKHAPDAQQSIPESLMTQAVLSLLFMLVFAFLSAWFFTVVYGAYKYLKDKAMFSLMNGMPAGVVVTDSINAAPPPYPGYETETQREIKIDKH